MKKHIASGCLAVLIAASALAAKPGDVVTRQLTYAGLPTITYVSNSDGRLTDVSMGRKQIVSYDWSEEPYTVPVRFFNHWSVSTSVMPDGSGTQQVNDAQGAQRAIGSVLPHGPNRHTGHICEG